MGTEVPAPFMISVVVITWNRKADILETVQAVYDQDYKDFEIIVVDNGSEDGSVEALSQAYPQVKLIALDSNLGVTRARNVGIKVAKGDLLLFLDSDASPVHDTLSNLAKKFQAEPRLGVVNSKIVNAYTMEIDNTAGWVYTEKDKDSQNIEFLSFSFSEGGCAIRKTMFDKVGLFWEQLFFGSEGMEFSLRVLDADFDILYYPDSLVVHRASPVSRIKGGNRDEILFRSCMLVYLLRFPWWLFMFFAPLKTGATLFRSMRRGYSRQILLGLRNFVAQAPAVLKERKPIRNKTALNYVKLQRQHGTLRWDLITWLKYKT